jgi:hypothetical protein
MSVRHTIPSGLANLAYQNSLVSLGPISILYFAICDPHWDAFVLPVVTCALVVAGLFGPRLLATPALTISWVLWFLSQWIVSRSAL